MFNVSENAVPTQYPLAMGYMGQDVTRTVRSPDNIQEWWNYLLKSYPQQVTAQDRQDMFAAFDDNNPAAGNATINRINRRILEYGKPPKKASLLDKLGPNDELIAGVKNLYIYTGVVLLGLAGFFKKRS